jgi:O-antigen/teichoic acid export membrane protein
VIGLLISSRYIQIIRGTAAQASSRVIMMLLPLITIPVTINYLGGERFGMWMAVVSMSSLLVITEGGISNAVITPVAQANARGDVAGVRRLMASATAMLALPAVTIILFALLCTDLIDWRTALKLKSDLAVHEAANVFRVLACAVAMSFPVNVILKARRGLGQVAAVAGWETVGSMLALLALLGATTLKLGTPWLAAALMFTPIVVNLAGVAVFTIRNPQLTPRSRDVEPSIFKTILRSGAMFLMAGIASAAVISLDSILIARMGGAEEVGPYAVAQRLFTLPFVFANFWFYSQWPVLAEAIHRGETAWVRSSFLVTLGAAASLSALLAVGLALGFGPITKLWIGAAMHPDPLLLWGMAAFSVLMVVCGACSTLMYALEARRQQFFIMAGTTALAISLKILLLQMFMPAGAVLATVAVYLLTQVVPYSQIIPRRLAGRRGSVAA